MGTESNNNRIQSFYALRGLAFLGIFFRHAYVDISWAELGVSLFFVLSGFLSIQFSTYNAPPSFVNSLRYMIRKAKKLYLLHIITLVLTVLFIKTSAETVCVSKTIQIVLNVLLVQSWIPYSDVNTSINGVAWFFSTLLFLYFAFPYLQKWLRSQSRRKIYSIPAMIIVSQYLLCSIALNIFGKNSRTYIWFMYCFPVFRLGDFAIGCCVGKLCSSKQEKDLDKTKITIWGILLLVITICCLYLIKRSTNSESFVITFLCNWTTPYIPIATIWILYYFHYQESISKVINNRILRFLGRLSPYLFFIHYFVIRLNYSFLSDNGIGGWGNALINLVISVVFSCVYMRMVNPRSWKILLHEMEKGRK